MGPPIVEEPIFLLEIQILALLRALYPLLLGVNIGKLCNLSEPYYKFIYSFWQNNKTISILIYQLQSAQQVDHGGQNSTPP